MACLGSRWSSARGGHIGVGVGVAGAARGGGGRGGIDGAGTSCPSPLRSSEVGAAALHLPACHGVETVESSAMCMLTASRLLAVVSLPLGSGFGVLRYSTGCGSTQPKPAACRTQPLPAARRSHQSVNRVGSGRPSKPPTSLLPCTACKTGDRRPVKAGRLSWPVLVLLRQPRSKGLKHACQGGVHQTPLETIRFGSLPKKSGCRLLSLTRSASDQPCHHRTSLPPAATPC